MAFTSKFMVGETVSNSDIHDEFQCGIMGGMRRSLEKDTLVIITDSTKGLYDDNWDGDILHYTGMGKSGDQSLSFQQNKTLSQSNSMTISVHLFEVLIPKRYIYHGEVVLCDTPYQEEQLGEDGRPRKVWMFPLKPVTGSITVSLEDLAKHDSQESAKARKLDDKTLKNRAKARQREKPSRRAISRQVVYKRDSYVKEESKRRAHGKCQLCGAQAPFQAKNGEWYLENHHIDWLANGGPDTLDNVSALCPNCHRKMHALNLPEDVASLRTIAKRLSV